MKLRSSRRQSLLQILGLILATLISESRADSPAEVWEHTVDELIPLSFDLAKNAAHVRESTLFVHTIGQAQSHLSHAYDSITAFGELRPLLLPHDSLIDQLGAVRLDAVLLQLVVTSQLVEAQRLVKENVANFAKAQDTLTDACSDDFTAYNVDTTFVVAQAPMVNAAEGVYVECCDIPTLLRTLGMTFAQVVTNAEENRRISEQTQRFVEKRAHDTDYRKFALEQCRELQKSTTVLFKQYEPLARQMRDWLASTSNASQVHGAVRSLLENFSERAVVAALSHAEADVFDRIFTGGPDAYLQRVQLSEVAVLRDAVELTSQHPCDPQVAVKVLAAASIVQLLSLPDAEHLKTDARQILLRAGERCKGGASVPGMLVPAAMENWHPRRSLPLLVNLTAPGKSVQTCRTYIGSQTFCERLFSETNAANVPIGFYSTADGGLVAHLADYSYRADVQGSLVTTPNNPWVADREGIAHSLNVPGSTYSSLARAEQERLDAIVHRLKAYNNYLKNTAAGLDSSAKKYSAVPLPHATVTATQEIQNRVSADVMGLKAIQDTFAASATLPNPYPTASLATPALREFEDRLKDHMSTSPTAARADLEALWRAHSGEPDTLSSYDRDAISNAYAAYFNGAGLYRGVQPSTTEISDGLASSVASPIGTFQGTNVRLAANRGLFAYDHTSGTNREVAAGSVSLALSADVAYQTGSVAAGDRLVNDSLAAADVALGLVPIASSLNDATQLAFGMVTGYDYAGRRMTSADFALRGVGIVLGVVPASAVIRLGGSVISRGFVEGAQLLRSAGLGSRVASALAARRNLVAGFAAGVGIALGEQGAVDAALLTNRLERAVSILERPLGDPGTKSYISLLEGFGQQDARQFIDSFEPSGIRFNVVLEEQLYRWHNNDAAASQFGRFLSRELIADPKRARAMLALPDSNQALFLDEFKVASGTPVFEGPVRVPSGVTPGAQVFLVTKSPKDVLSFVRRIAP